MLKRQISACLLGMGFLFACKGNQKPVGPDKTLEAPSGLIATQTIKELVKSNQPVCQEEKILIGGETYHVSTVKKSVYRYDSLGRIVTEYNRYPTGALDTISFQYTNSSVWIQLTTYLSLFRARLS
jgi:hypothetical protein